MSEGANSSASYRCCLPIPFVKGKPVDYQIMNVEQLRTFIPFVYTCMYKKSLPNSANSGGSAKPPSWWPKTVTFDKNLRVRGPTSQRGALGLQRELSTLVKKCYEHLGVSALLALGQELSKGVSGYTLERANKRNLRVVNDEGCTVVMIDKFTRTYDCTPTERAFLEKESRENVNAPPKNKVIAKSKNQKPVKQKTAVKRKLFETEEKDEKSHLCMYCNKEFKAEDFRDEHQSQCIRGPYAQTQNSQMNFMNALGMLGNSQKPPVPASSSVDPPLESASLRPRNLRKLPKRNQLMSLIKTNPIPLTSQRGQRLVKELGEKVEPRFPAEYERQCAPKSGFPIVEKDFPTVTKRIILKDGENPHIFTQGRRQRTERYQELVVGLNRSCWSDLNKLKRLRIVVDKLDPNMKTIAVPPNKKSYLEQRWEAATTLPHVRLVDFRKHMTDELRKLVPDRIMGSPKPGTSKSKL